jgi:hypothetical protein
LLLLAGVAAGQGLGDPLYVTGFVSQGYLNTSNVNYLVPRSVNGTAEFAEAAITVVARPEDKLRVGIQLLARNFGDTGNDFVAVDWAYGDYHWRDWLGMRVGKVKMPFGFYNEGRDVDILRTAIFLPQSIYNEKMRDFIQAYQGAGAYGNFTLGGYGEGEYHLFGGTLNVPDPTRGFWKDVYAGAAEDIEDEVEQIVSDDTGRTATATYDEFRDAVVSFPWVYGGAVTWQTPLRGLSLGATGFQGRFNIQGRLRYDVLLEAETPGALPDYAAVVFDLDDTTEIDHIAVFSAEFLRDRWSLAAEFLHEKIGDDAAYGWYVQAGWQVGDRVALGAYYSHAQVDESDVAEVGLPDYYAWQSDFTLSLRVDLTEHWLLKIEDHFIDGVNLAQRRRLDVEKSDPRPKNWSMLAAKVTFHF